MHTHVIKNCMKEKKTLLLMIGECESPPKSNKNGWKKKKKVKIGGLIG